jgi:hypothetical protein
LLHDFFVFQFSFHFCSIVTTLMNYTEKPQESCQYLVLHRLLANGLSSCSILRCLCRMIYMPYSKILIFPVLVSKIERWLALTDALESPDWSKPGIPLCAFPHVAPTMPTPCYAARYGKYCLLPVSDGIVELSAWRNGFGVMRSRIMHKDSSLYVRWTCLSLFQVS